MQYSLFPELYCAELAKKEGILGAPFSILQRMLMTTAGKELIDAVDSDQKAGLNAAYSKHYNKERTIDPGGYLSADVLLIFCVARAYFPDCFGARGWQLLTPNLDIHKALGRLEVDSFPGRSTIHDHYNFLSGSSLDKFHQLILHAIKDEGFDDFQWLTMDSTAIASVSTWPVDSDMLFRLLEKTYDSLLELIEQQRQVKGWSSRMNRLPIKTVENLLVDINKEKLKIAYAKGKKGAKKIRRDSYKVMCRKGDRLLDKLGDIADKLDLQGPDKSLVEKWNENFRNAHDRLFFVQERFKLAEMSDLGDYEPEKILSLSDEDAVFIQKGGREITFGYKPNICRSANGFISAIYMEKGNPADSKVLLPSVELHQQQTGVLPALVSTDDGYSCAASDEALIEMGVHAFSASGSKGKRMSGDEVWDLDLMREMRRMRSNAEATISHYKIDFNISRLSVGGYDGVYRELKLRAIAFNLEKLGKMLIAKAPAEKKIA